MADMEIWKAWLQSVWRLRHAKRRDERGDITQVVIIVALFAAAAIAISAIIISKFTEKARSIPTG